MAGAPMRPSPRDYGAVKSINDRCGVVQVWIYLVNVTALIDFSAP